MDIFPGSANNRREIKTGTGEQVVTDDTQRREQKDRAPGRPERARDLLALTAFLGVCLLVSLIGGLVTATSVGAWYTTLEKPVFIELTDVVVLQVESKLVGGAVHKLETKPDTVSRGGPEQFVIGPAVIHRTELILQHAGEEIRRLYGTAGVGQVIQLQIRYSHLLNKVG